eukprot:CAMPEP_0184652532 /NCGR_PEP_ID=MMETSP0308-20130426/10240_1 /TAXON_ID=38269 /ORGANISM="Gloeochaete witrockiana, Strain SAG 46.84" /LENGTH=265 /DNA_ID=CAMNT_0027087469 /DNA_START=133 /DNA_END=927 /DNA_ORIENTATION=-
MRILLCFLASSLLLNVHAHASHGETLDYFASAPPVDPTTSHLSNQPKPLLEYPGFTRSVVERNYALITPESRVVSPLIGWTQTTGIVYISPAMGARHLFYTASLERDGQTDFAPPGVERFFYVLSGKVQIKYANGTEMDESELEGEGAYAYIPADTTHMLRALSISTLLVVERYYNASGGATVVVGKEQDFEPKVVPNEHFLLKRLLPHDARYDFNMHVMDFQPGEYLTVKEVHYNEHGLLLLRGAGIYRLGSDWYPVTSGDVIW